MTLRERLSRLGAEHRRTRSAAEAAPVADRLHDAALRVFRIASLAALATLLVLAVLIAMSPQAMAALVALAQAHLLLGLAMVFVIEGVPLLLPYIALVFFTLALVAGKTLRPRDLLLAIAGLGICMLRVAQIAEAATCAADLAASAFEACRDEAAGFALDQIAKGAVSDVFDVFGDTLSQISSEDFSVTDKLAVLSLRMYSEATLIAALGNLIAWIRGLLRPADT
jgi:hypothetical protein